MRLTDSVSPLDWSKYFKNFVTLISILLFCLESFWSNFSINVRWICGRISALPFSTMDLNLEQALIREWYVSSACSNDFLAKSTIISKIRQELCWSDFYPTHTDLVRVHRMFHRVDAPFFLRVCCVFYYDWFFVTVAVHRFLMNLQRIMVLLDRRCISCVEFYLFYWWDYKDQFWWWLW